MKPFAELEASLRSTVDELVANVEREDSALFQKQPWSSEQAVLLATFNEMIGALARMGACIAGAIPKLRKAHQRALKAMGDAPGGKS